ncbi:unnamed protein product (macronuclear) [Paramecium tetraurelia]|uniref:Uncharacterized protein n=1 Tax=Paramecium tetraurelia TaxID=5888 RepID=A0DJ71_PARTE|nr:uncharacterized protein GSPATT00017445001 [Paramecium tetraurelia]CAK83088.1 unnamed protein product [Paramecium tetraurelia]|eukprot:XP_001450485.1 hypothetical protein (macronuclear) [Paramecium tetraurelia strain d4-2]
MFICCKTKNKRAKQSTHNDSEVRSFSKENHQDEKAQNPDQDRNSKQNSNEANQTEDSHKEILNVVNQIKAYRDLGQVKESVDLEKLFVNGLLAEDLPIVYFIEYRWAIQYTGYLGGMKKAPPKEINNNKILTDDHRTQDTIHITIDNDPQLLPGIQPERHYSLINERAWKFVHLLYGGGPTVTIDLDNAKLESPQNEIQDSRLVNDKECLEVQPIDKINNEPNGMLPLQIGTQLELINDGATHVTATTILPIRQSRDPLLDFKLSCNNIEDIDKSASGNLLDWNITGQTNKVKIFSKVPMELPIIGFHNPKYNCYMNAALQCLLSIPKFIRKILKIQKQSNRQFTTACQDLIRLIQGTIPGQSINLDLLAFICQQKFKPTQQQDSHEFLLFILSQIQEELIGKKNSEKQEFLSATEAWETYTRRNPDLITELFTGQISNKNYCLKCKKTCEVYDPILDLNLPIQNTPGLQEIKLMDCLKNYFKEEQIFNDWQCNLCQYKNKFLLRQLQITHKPQFLIIHLKRFAQVPRNQKIQNEISYPEILNMKEYCTENVVNPEYKLKGLISHQGQINSGHYKAYTRRQNVWYEFDDDVVTIDKKNRHLTDKGAYIIFYEAL